MLIFNSKAVVERRGFRPKFSMTRIARETGLGRESLYKSLSNQGNPEFATVLKVLQALGLRLQVVPIT